MLKRFLRFYKKDETGASAVEFALVAPILIFLLAGTVDIAYYIQDQMKIQNTAAAVADYAAQVQSAENAQVVAEEAYGESIENLTVTTTFECECADGVVVECPVDCGAGDYQRRYIDVVVNGTFEPLFPYPGLAGNMTLARSARMRVD